MASSERSATDDIVSAIMGRWATAFSSLDAGALASPRVQFTDVRTAHAAADLINVAGTATFVVEEDAEPLTVKITWVIIREGGEWKIVSHHVSSKTPLIAP